MCINRYILWKQYQIIKYKVYIRTKAHKWWDNHERDQYIKNIEYLIEYLMKPAGVYTNDVYNFITIEEDEKA